MSAAFTSRRALALILVLFALVSAAFSLTTPLFEGPDEPAHFGYARHIAQGKGLPLFAPERESAGGETFQPPLYYAAVAPLLALAGAGDLPLAENPHVIYEVGAWTNLNRYVHRRWETFLFQEAVLGAHLVRLAGVAIGMGVVAMTYALARELFPARRSLAPGAAALAAFVPQFAFTSAMTTNDVAVVFLTTAGLWYTARLARRLPRAGTRNFAALGVLIGLAPLAKESGLALAPAAALTVFVAAGFRRAWSTLARAAIVFPIVAGTVGWWYFARYEILGFWVGNPASAQAMGTMTLEELLAQWTEIEISFWGLFGWTSVPMPQAIYDALHFLAIAGLAGIIVGLLRRTWTRSEILALAALGGWCLLVLLAYVRWLSATFQAHGRLLFPALPAFAILAAAGLGQWVPRRWVVIPPAVAAVGLCLVSFWSALVLMPQAFPAPRFVSESAAAAMPLRPAANLSGQIELLGAKMETRRRGGREALEVTAVWKAQRVPDTDYTVTVQVFAPDGTRIGQLDTYPVSAMYPTSDWRAGETLADLYPVSLAAGVRPLQATVVIGMYDHTSGRGLPVVYPDGRTAARVILGQIELR